MHTTPGTEASPDVLADRDAGLAAGFAMLCERMGKLEEIAEHWLCRERDTEWTYNGKVDSQLLDLHAETHVWRNEIRPVRPRKATWQTVNIASSDPTPPASFLLNETRRLQTKEAMLRLGVDPTRFWMAQPSARCSDVGLDSDFDFLVDAVSEEMFRAAVFQANPKNLETLLNMFAILKRGGVEEAERELSGNPYKEMLPTRWAIVQGVENLCTALGLQHPQDTSKRFSAATLNSESAGVKGIVQELLRLCGTKSRATEGPHELKTHVGNVLEDFCGCDLEVHEKKHWVDGRTVKDYAYSVRIKDPYAMDVGRLLSV